MENSGCSCLKVYLGDGVYADFRGHSIVLTTENGISETNRIYLEPRVVEAFDNYWRSLPDRIRRIQCDPDGDMGRMEHDDKGDN